MMSSWLSSSQLYGRSVVQYVDEFMGTFMKEPTVDLKRRSNTARSNMGIEQWTRRTSEKVEREADEE